VPISLQVGSVSILSFWLVYLIFNLIFVQVFVWCLAIDNECDSLALSE